jgi:hypothetical protein
MAFLERAKSMYEQQEVVRAATILAEGLKRDPAQVQALEWLMELYVHELPSPGLERELLCILEQQANGQELFELMERELEGEAGEDKLHALRKVMQRERITLRHQPPATATGPLSLPTPTSPPPRELELRTGVTAEPHEGPEEDWDALATGDADTRAPATAADRRSPDPHPREDAGSRRTAPADHEALSRINRALPPLQDDQDADDLAGPWEGTPEEDSRWRPLMMLGVFVALALMVFALAMSFLRGTRATDAPGAADEVAPAVEETTEP